MTEYVDSIHRSTKMGEERSLGEKMISGGARTIADQGQDEIVGLVF